jgi:hypothetical protein
MYKQPSKNQDWIKRRKRLRRKKRIKKGLVFTSIIIALVCIFLFSPAGPYRHILFPPSQEGTNRGLQNGEKDRFSQSAVSREAEDQNGNGQEARTEKESDSTPPAVAIVVDDTGDSIENLQQWMEIDAPLTFSVLPHQLYSREEAERLWEAGYQIMMHIPTENAPPHPFSARGELEVKMDRDTVFRTLDDDLSSIPHVIGINNHQGGRGCDDLRLMTCMCEWAKLRGFFVVDSKSSYHSKVAQAEVGLGMGRKVNQVFIDHQNDPDYIRSAMRNLADIARRNGCAIGICHFHRPNTPRIVKEMILTLKAEGINFAFVQDVNN